MLETERLILRQFTAEDFTSVYEILSDKETMQFWPEPFDQNATKIWLNRAIESYGEKKLGRLALILKANGALIGHCGIMLAEVNGTQENDLGYIVFRKYWGQGLASEAAAACLKYGVEKLGLQRIVANMEVKHTVSRKVAEKLGFKIETEFFNSRNRNLPTYLLTYTVE